MTAGFTSLVLAAIAAAVPTTTAPGMSSTWADTTFHYATVDSVRVFYREAGRKDAPAIVLLHGFPSSSRMYDRLIPLLADRYHVIAPDYPGFGESEAPPPTRYRYTFDHLAKTTAALLSHLKIDRYVLFMQDYGGPVGFRMAVSAPGHVRAMIVQNANAYREGLGPKWAELAKYWQDRAANGDKVDAFLSLEGAKQRHLGNSPNPERYDPQEWKQESAMLARPGQRDIQADLLYDYRTNVAAYPEWQAWLRRHRPPLLVLWGGYDPSFIAPGSEAYRRDVPDAEIHILNAGHFALDEATDDVARLTREFLEKLSLRTQ